MLKIFRSFKIVLLVFMIMLLISNIHIFAQESQPLQNNQQAKPPTNQALDYINTADEFLNKIAEFYASITDLKAQLYMKVNKDVSEGVIFIKPPNMMRINFSNPNGQVINNNGEDFYIYIPSQNVALYQKKSPLNPNAVDGILTKTGLDLLIKNYLITYLTTPEYVRLSQEENINNLINRKVMLLKLTWKNTSQNFRQLILYIGEDSYIYRIDGVTYNNEQVQFIFYNIAINQGIPNTRFDYDPPKTAFVSENFLFEE